MHAFLLHAVPVPASCSNSLRVPAAPPHLPTEQLRKENLTCTHLCTHAIKTLGSFLSLKGRTKNRADMAFGHGLTMHGNGDISCVCHLCVVVGGTSDVSGGGGEHSFPPHLPLFYFSQD